MMQTRFVPSAETVRAFRDALGSFPTGVTVVTAIGLDGAPVGITANSFASVSLDPPLVLWSPAKLSRRYAHFERAVHYAIHVLAEDQADICARFSQPGGWFEGVPPVFNDEGVPVLEDVLARFDCRLEARHDGGDHTILIGRVLRVHHRAGLPLCFLQGRYARTCEQP